MPSLVLDVFASKAPSSLPAGAEANRRYPGTLKLPSHYKCVFESVGGILHANRAVAALQVHVLLYMYYCHLASFPGLAGTTTVT